MFQTFAMLGLTLDGDIGETAGILGMRLFVLDERMMGFTWSFGIVSHQRLLCLFNLNILNTNNSINLTHHSNR